MSAVNVRYGLYPGDRLMVTAEKKKKKATVVKEYPFHILMAVSYTHLTLPTTSRV